ncbi:MAG: TolC family protein, partial [FCB group bacterium]
KYVVEANKSLVTSAWTSNLPIISANAGYNWKSPSLLTPTLLSSWNVGLSFSLPIFQGFALDAGIDLAKANLNIAEAVYDADTQAAILDVSQQFSSLQEAKERISATTLLVTQANETLKLAEGRYNNGVGSPLEITDARVTVYNAKTSYFQSLYDYHVDYSRLQRAMGVLK